MYFTFKSESIRASRLCMCCYSLKTEIENFQGAERPSFFVGYELQTVRIESMNPIESPTTFWKNNE